VNLQSVSTNVEILEYPNDKKLYWTRIFRVDRASWTMLPRTVGYVLSHRQSYRLLNKDLRIVRQRSTVDAEAPITRTWFNVNTANAGFIPVVSAKAFTRRRHTPAAVSSLREVMKRSTAKRA
jgi:hypothetical protein